MKAWPSPFIPALPGAGLPVRVHDTASAAVRPLTPGPVARMYVCGITPYDATHMGHAATYVTFDVLGRALRDAGHEVLYVQNITDVDEPLLERAQRDGVDWQDLAAGEIALFREDMTALAVIAPDHYIGVVESIEPGRQDRAASCWPSGAAYRGRAARGGGRPRRERPLPRPVHRARLRRRVVLDARADDGGVRRPRRRPRPGGQARPARPAAVARRAARASRPGRAGSSARGARAGTSSAPPSRWTTWA